MKTAYNQVLNREFNFTIDQIETAYHQGDCEEGSATVANQIAYQFEGVSDSQIGDYVCSYGIESEDVSKMDRHTLIMYAVWLMAGSIADDSEYETENYFYC